MRHAFGITQLGQAPQDMVSSVVAGERNIKSPLSVCLPGMLTFPGPSHRIGLVVAMARAGLCRKRHIGV